jgi:tetraacyldisaccharide 4'-kinase
MGGTGKTPAVEYVARLLNEEGWRVAILSRGYGAEDGRNDEAMVLEENLPEVPHLQGRDRVELAWIALEELEAEVLVLDDAMQHRRMARSLDLVLLDATDPWGGNGLLPRGLLREPRSGLRRAQCVLLTRCDQVDETTKHRIREVVTRIAPAVPIVESVHEPTLLLGPAGMEADLELLREHPLGAFCGIGNPLAFRATLEKLGGRLVDFLGFPDHHPYDREDVNKLHAWAERLPEDVVIVTTQKDWVKLRVPQLGGRPLWAVRIALRLTVGQDVLESMLKEVAGAQGVATR